jgi:hypothetical protein
MLGEEPVILWHARDESTLDGLMLYQISPVSDCLAAKKVACRLLLGGGEAWPVRFVYTPFLNPLGFFHEHDEKSPQQEYSVESYCCN